MNIAKISLLILTLILSGCNSTKTVYPNDSVVVSTYKIEKVDPQLMIAPQNVVLPTEDQLNNSSDTTEALNLVVKNNQEVWQEDRNKLRGLQSYVSKLQNYLIKINLMTP